MNLHLGKSFIAFMAMLCCFSSEANSQKKFCLSEVEALIEGDYNYYGYNKDGKLDSVYSYTSYYDEELYFLYKYDDKGNMIKSQGFCIIPSEDDEFRDFTQTYEIVYGYDENNRKISRKNYNLDLIGGTNEFLLGGVYYYTYDEKGVLQKRELFWDEGMTDLYETTNYTYDEFGRLLEESYIHNNFGNISEEMVITYFYDDQDRLTRIKTDVLDHNTGQLTEDDNLSYKYDENGNLISRLSYGKNPNVPNEEHRLVYYTDTLAAYVAMPINEEDDMDFYIRSKNVVKEDSLYRRDAEGVSFDLYDINKWNYGNLNVDAGIENLFSEGNIVGISRDAEGNLLLGGVENHENVRIYDVNGRIVRNSSYNGKVDVNTLPHGMYVIATRQGCVKISR